MFQPPVSRSENCEGARVGEGEVAEMVGPEAWVGAVVVAEDDAWMVKLQDAMPPWWRIVLETQARYASTSE